MGTSIGKQTYSDALSGPSGDDVNLNDLLRHTMRTRLAEVAIAVLVMIGLIVTSAQPAHSTTRVGATVTGTVRVDGQGVPGAKVCEGAGPEDPKANCATTVANGQYTLTGVKGWDKGGKPMFRPSLFPVDVQRSLFPRADYFQDVEVDEGSTVAGVNFDVTGYPLVSGRVTNILGDPVRGAAINGGEDQPIVLTGADGRYQTHVTVASRGSTGSITVTAPGYNEAQITAISVSASGANVRLTATGPVFSGQITDWRGNPAVAAKVCVEPTPVRAKVCVASTDSQGRYSVALPKGSYQARAEGADGSTSSLIWGDAVPGRDETIDFFLTRPAGVLVEGTVTDWVNRPVAGAKICVSATKCLTTSDSNGKYWLLAPAGEYTAWAAGLNRTSNVIRGSLVAGIDLKGVDFRLATPGTLSSTVPKISGKAKVGRKLTVKPGSWRPAPVKLTYQWYVGGRAIRGATKSSLAVVKSYRGKRITVKVSGTKPGYYAKSVVSAKTKKVAR